jgi:hypothetical protein
MIVTSGNQIALTIDQGVIGPTGPAGPAGGPTGPTGPIGGVSSVAWTGGIVSVADPTSNPVLSVSGTAGGIPYFVSGTEWASSGALGTNVLSALQVNLNATGGMVTSDGSATLTGKRIDPRVNSVATASTVTPSIALYDQYDFTALASSLSVLAPVGSPVNGDKLIFRILDDGTPRALTWNPIYREISTLLPAATVANKVIYVGCIYNGNSSYWDVIAVAIQT